MKHSFEEKERISGLPYEVIDYICFLCHDNYRHLYYVGKTPDTPVIS